MYGDISVGVYEIVAVWSPVCCCVGVLWLVELCRIEGIAGCEFD